MCVCVCVRVCVCVCVCVCMCVFFYLGYLNTFSGYQNLKLGNFTFCKLLYCELTCALIFFNVSIT